MLVRLADWCYRQRRLVVVLWIAALVGAFALAGAFGGEFKQDYLQPGSESQAAADTLAGPASRRRPATRCRSSSTPRTASPRPRSGTRAEDIFADVAADPPRRGCRQPFTDGRRRPDLRRTARRRTPTSPSTRRPTSSPPHEAKALVEPILAAGDDTLQVEVGGPVAALSQTAPVGAEGIGLIAAAIILLFTFGSAVAMGLPLITAVFGLGIAMALGELLRRVVDVPDWAPPPRRWSASASASTTRCSSSPGTAAASPKAKTRDRRP